jgi:hypothetical protein
MWLSILLNKSIVNHLVKYKGFVELFTVCKSRFRALLFSVVIQPPRPSLREKYRRLIMKKSLWVMAGLWVLCQLHAVPVQARERHWVDDERREIQYDREQLNREREQRHREFDAIMRDLDEENRDIDRWQNRQHQKHSDHQEIARIANRKRDDLNRERDRINRERDQMNRFYDEQNRELDRHNQQLDQRQQHQHRDW